MILFESNLLEQELKSGGLWSPDDSSTAPHTISRHQLTAYIPHSNPSYVFSQTGRRQHLISGETDTSCLSSLFSCYCLLLPRLLSLLIATTLPTGLSRTILSTPHSPPNSSNHPPHFEIMSDWDTRVVCVFPLRRPGDGRRLKSEAWTDLIPPPSLALLSSSLPCEPSIEKTSLQHWLPSPPTYSCQVARRPQRCSPNGRSDRDVLQGSEQQGRPRTGPPEDCRVGQGRRGQASCDRFAFVSLSSSFSSRFEGRELSLRTPPPPSTSLFASLRFLDYSQLTPPSRFCMRN